VTEKITTAKGELLVLETKLGELVKAAEKAKQDEAEAAAAQAALDALQADIAEKGKQIDAIKAKLKKK
jgi:predicted RNase H-like nuclease (RuvC/YqgF family)